MVLPHAAQNRFGTFTVDRAAMLCSPVLTEARVVPLRLAGGISATHLGDLAAFR